MHRHQIGSLVTALAALGALAASPLYAQKYGGILKSMQRENPNSLSILDESGSFVTAWPMGGVYNNVVYFDPLKPIDSFETVIPELAKSWAWNADHTQLTFALNPGVKWHDGTPFTAKDVKHTFDVVRDASAQKLRINPRRYWWFNVADIATSGDHQVTFHLGRPQPSLLLLLACGLSPVYPAHVPLAELRTTALGTGPFKLIDFKRDQALKVRKNPGYFVRDRPYLDGVDYIIIKNKATRTAALQSGQVDTAQPNETDQLVYESLKASVRDMEFNRTPTTGSATMMLNRERPPFTNPRLRQAFSMALDRAAFTRSVEPGYIVGGLLLNRPHGSWGLPDGELLGLPGYREPALDKAEARKLMVELGYGPANLLRVKVTVQSVQAYRNWAAWALGELKQIYVTGELDVVELGNYYPRMARKEYAISVLSSASPVDEPDLLYYEGFICGAPRNYSNFCDKDMEKLFDRQSMTMDYEQRVAQVGEIERKLLNDVSQIPIAFRVEYNARRSYVKNYVGHNTSPNWARMQDVWLDK
jgi:peptide/nickel transport system substrate-binding protein